MTRDDREGLTRRHQEITLLIGIYRE